ncbi:hypothetical protein AMJ44_05345 [candidate division WOR-1 bacterium DG_54_3]|uniref:Uncharacterized protein n=1 Tax=candidate division WOR-1 bacterium DG_54_3 TaxID=1703775 RepID=A0A0S7Y264_UNCSA|nr:MAG: hypothetical protein AMJ44_05345 [candidate division WOR-1 bacterium DG_54_3]
MKIRNPKSEIRNNKFLNWLLVISLLVITAAGGLGCARTVTTLWTYGDQMMVEVTMKGTIATSANRYFLVLSLDPNYKIPLPSPNLDQEAPEFIEPGMVPQVGSPEAYYTKFFSTWSGYIVLDRNEYYLAKGPFVIDQAFTREVISILGETGDKITFSFRLQQMFGDLPDQTQIYFDFVSVPWPDGEEKIPADHLPSTNNYISNIAGSIFAMDDLEDPSLDPSLDIIKCRVEIQ